MIGQIVAALITLTKAIPQIGQWIDAAISFYVQERVKEMRLEHRRTIQKALAEQDQREIEKLMGSARAGTPSGIPGTEIRDKLPGVK